MMDIEKWNMNDYGVRKAHIFRFCALCAHLNHSYSRIHKIYSPMDCITSRRAVFMGAESGSLEEGSPLQSQS